MIEKQEDEMNPFVVIIGIVAMSMFPKYALELFDILWRMHI